MASVLSSVEKPLTGRFACQLTFIFLGTMSSNSNLCFLALLTDTSVIIFGNVAATGVVVRRSAHPPAARTHHEERRCAAETRRRRQRIADTVYRSSRPERSPECGLLQEHVPVNRQHADARWVQVSGDHRKEITKRCIPRPLSSTRLGNRRHLSALIANATTLRSLNVIYQGNSRLAVYAHQSNRVARRVFEAHEIRRRLFHLGGTRISRALDVQAGNEPKRTSPNIRWRSSRKARCGSTP